MLRSKGRNLMDNQSKETIIKNLQQFINFTQRSNNWFIEKTNISKEDFENLLNGEGDILNNIEKILQLYGIENKFYFHQKDFKLPERPRNRLITDLPSIHREEVKNEETDFKLTMEMLDDFVNIFELLKANQVNKVNYK